MTKFNKNKLPELNSQMKIIIINEFYETVNAIIGSSENVCNSTPGFHYIYTRNSENLLFPL